MDAIDKSMTGMDYEHLDREIKRTMRRSASDAVLLGYLLRKMYDGQLWMEMYDCLDEYLQRELHMDYSMATRFMNINKKYSVGGNSREIADDWTGFSQSVLIEMLNMPPELAAMVTPDMTVRQVQEVKRQAKRAGQEKKAEAAATVQETRSKECRIAPDIPCGIDAVIEEHFTKGGDVDGCAGCCAGCMKKGECSYICGVAKSQMAEGQKEASDGQLPEQCGGKADFPAKDEVPDAEFRELEPAAEVATSQPLEQVRPDKRQSQYLDDFAKRFIRFKREWMLADFDNRVMDITRSPEEIKGSLSEYARTWYFASGKDKAARIELLDGHVSLWDGEGRHMGDFDWFYVAAAIHRMWNVVALEAMAAPHMDTAQAIDVSGGDTAPQEDAAEDVPEAEAAEPEAEEREQPPLPPLKNNDQRRAWLKSYKDWGLWYRDDNIGVDYYKYDFENGVRLIVEVYQEEATRYCGAYESSFLHLIGGREAPMDQHGTCKWQMHKRYARHPNSETELVEFLKELQRKGGGQG